MKVDEPVLDRMKLFLDYAAKNQKVITSNLANAETPGYRAQELPFEDVFQSELAGHSKLQVTDPKHISTKPTLVRKPFDQADDAMGHDGNNVDLDKEMTALAKNVLKFSVVSQMFQQKVRIIELSLTEGSR
jgi:flagellar basal-body rod protein FlgB